LSCSGIFIGTVDVLRTGSTALRGIWAAVL